MQVSVETLKGLERKIIISVPTEKIEEEVGQRLRSLAHKVKVDGFRPGKVPFKVVEKRYSDSVRFEVAKDMVQPTLFEALKNNHLTPAGQPNVEFEQIELGKDFKYNAVFEVFPQFEINELNQATVEVVHAEVTDKDVKAMIDSLRAQNRVWSDVSRAVSKDDKVVIDFEGFVDGKLFEGGTASNYALTLGEGSMIPGFEEGLFGAEIDKPFDLKVTFPEDYGHKELAGKEALFKTTVKQVQEGALPKLDDAFAEQFNIKEGGVDALMKDIKENMVRELERRVSTMNREAIFDKLLEKNSIDLPNALIDQEIANLRHEMYHRVFGHEHSEDEKIPDFPRELFEEQARRRVQLGLIFSEYVKKHELIVDTARVNAMIEKFATAYESPDELRAYYKENDERMGEIEALVMEEMVSDKIAEDAVIVKKSLSYDAVVNPKKDKKGDDTKGE